LDGPNPHGRIDVISGAALAQAGSLWDMQIQPSAWTILGASPQEELGDALAAGDFNGDGIDDLAAGVAGGHVTALDNQGKVYLWYGGPDRLSDSVTDLRSDQADCTIHGAQRNGGIGHAVQFMQLLGGPEKELVVGAPYVSPRSGDPEEDKKRYQWGAIYIFGGQPDLPPIVDLAVRPADVTIYGTTQEALVGYQLAGGKILSENFDDLLTSGYWPSRSKELAAEGVAVILPTERMNYTANAEIHLATPDQAIRIWGGNKQELIGPGLAVGDIDGDNSGDVLIGAPAAMNSMSIPFPYTGILYLFYNDRIRMELYNKSGWLIY